jgi:lycopene beta-cyclase
MAAKSDVLIVGGGLAGCLTALKFSAAKPDAPVVLVEEQKVLAGQQTWIFQESDLAPESLEWLLPVVKKTWEEATVQFPRLKRTFEASTSGKFHAVRSEDLHKAVIAKYGSEVILKSKVIRCTDSQAALENGKTLVARTVFDARGFAQEARPKLNGFHKYIAVDFKLMSPHGLTAPILIDATCPQLDGYRFFTVIPWDRQNVTVRETYYSENADLNFDRIRLSIRSYAERLGWRIDVTDREESRVTPIPMTSEYLAPSVTGEPLPIGTRGGYFHAMTGDEFVDSVRTAEFLAALVEPTTQTARDALMKHRRAWLSRQRFYRLLNRWLFYAVEPSLRYQVIQHFYELPQDVVGRLCGGRTTWSDRIRILKSRPPIRLERAFRSLSEKAMQARME